MWGQLLLIFSYVLSIILSYFHQGCLISIHFFFLFFILIAAVVRPKSFASAKCEVSLILVHFSFLPLLSCAAQERSKGALGFNVRLRSTFSLLRFACCRICGLQNTLMMRQRVKTRITSFAQTVDAMHSLRRIAYFASASLKNPNLLRARTMKKSIRQ